jgi:hypothetical protein
VQKGSKLTRSAAETKNLDSGWKTPAVVVADDGDVVDIQ